MCVLSLDVVWTVVDFQASCVFLSERNKIHHDFVFTLVTECITFIACLCL